MAQPPLLEGRTVQVVFGTKATMQHSCEFQLVWEIWGVVFELPSLAKEGWTRRQENIAKHPLTGAAGVVGSSFRLFGVMWLE